LWGLSRRANPTCPHTDRLASAAFDPAREQPGPLRPGERVGDPDLPGERGRLELFQRGQLIDPVRVGQVIDVGRGQRRDDRGDGFGDARHASDSTRS